MKSDKQALILRKHTSYLRFARALAPELVLELPELLEDELERDEDPDVELWDELDPLDDRELLSDELQINNTIKTNYSHSNKTLTFKRVLEAVVCGC